MRRAFIALALAVAAASFAGCSGNAERAPKSEAPAVERREDAGAALARAARVAVLDHHRLSVRVLWTNQVPARPRAVAGPALQALRQAARNRAQRGIRVRLLHEDFRILSLRLDPSYARAIAVVSDRQTTAVHQAGRPPGRSVELRERARVELRRPGQALRFVVWRVALIR